MNNYQQGMIGAFAFALIVLISSQIALAKMRKELWREKHKQDSPDESKRKNPP
jgi:hypothetical protein